MLFNSMEFLIFFGVVVALFFTLPQRSRNPLLLIASYYFYMSWNPAYSILLVASTLIDYSCGLAMGKSSTPSRRKLFLALSLTSNLGLLFFFKYANFISGSLEELLGPLFQVQQWPYHDFLLPVGISFYTFQTLSYSIDVYRGSKDPERNLIDFALYVSFFPQLVAGPIERSARFLPQLKQKYRFDDARFSDGLRMMLWGFFKKVVIADRLAQLVDVVYGHPQNFGAAALVLATVFFAFQIYCDFSGYSDIAIGAARIFGIELMDNFNRPYMARNIQDFWQRWHISLSTWFRDYVYIPLGGSKTSRFQWKRNIVITFVVSGLWHGANWTFVIWGALHGLYYLIGNATQPLRSQIVKVTHLNKLPSLHKGLQILFTFTLVCLAWVFFRANTASEAIFILEKIADNITDLFSIQTVKSQLLTTGIGFKEIALGVLLIGFLEGVHVFQKHPSILNFFRGKVWWKRWAFYYALIVLILGFGIFDKTEFIYFQF